MVSQETKKFRITAGVHKLWALLNFFSFRCLSILTFQSLVRHDRNPLSPSVPPARQRHPARRGEGRGAGAHALDHPGVYGPAEGQAGQAGQVAGQK